AVPGPLQGWLAFPHGRLAVHAPVDVAEVELAASLAVELEVAFFLLVNEVLVPGAHRHDAPSPGEVRFWFRLCFRHASTPSLPRLRGAALQGCTGSAPCETPLPEPPASYGG